jgi:hypothetical protein
MSRINPENRGLIASKKLDPWLDDPRIDDTERSSRLQRARGEFGNWTRNFTHLRDSCLTDRNKKKYGPWITMPPAVPTNNTLYIREIEHSFRAFMEAINVQLLGSHMDLYVTTFEERWSIFGDPLETLRLIGVYYREAIALTHCARIADGTSQEDAELQLHYLMLPFQRAFGTMPDGGYASILNHACAAGRREAVKYQEEIRRNEELIRRRDEDYRLRMEKEQEELRLSRDPIVQAQKLLKFEEDLKTAIAALQEAGADPDVIDRYAEHSRNEYFSPTKKPA